MPSKGFVKLATSLHVPAYQTHLPQDLPKYGDVDGRLRKRSTSVFSDNTVNFKVLIKSL